MTYEGVKTGWKNHHLDKNGLVVAARIAAGYVREDLPSLKTARALHYSIDARFTPENGDETIVRLAVSEPFFKSHLDEAHRTTAVRYLPENARVVEIEGEREVNRNLAAGPVFVLIGVVMIVLRTTGRLRREI